MPSMKEMLAAKKAQASRRDITADDINLRGSGLTQRTLERDAREYEREVERSIKHEDIAAQKAREQFNEAIEQTIASLEQENKVKLIELDESQQQALFGMEHQRVSILVGAAGTGKTTVTRLLLDNLRKRWREKHPEEQGTPPFRCCAYTGRATQQTRRALPDEWKGMVETIHKMLGYMPTEIEYDDFDEYGQAIKKTRRVFRPLFDETNKFPWQLIIIDEASMVPVPLFNEIIAAAPKNVRIILIGDLNQLPPVYAKSVLGYALRKWPTFELTKIHRQAAGNAIIANSQRVLKGLPLQKADNFFLVGGDLPAIQGQAGMQSFIRQTMSRLHKLGKYDPYRDAVISAVNDGLLGRHELNEFFQTMFNPERKEGEIIVNKRIKIHTGTGQAVYAVGDKVIIEQNINTENPPITNGMTGVIESININGRYDQKRSQADFQEGPIDVDETTLKLEGFMDDHINADETESEKPEKKDESLDQRQASHVTTIRFETGQTYTCSTAGDYNRINFGYCITCHKAQGGEYPNVIIILHSAFPSSLITQEWLYTAITRARSNVYLVFNSKGLQRALKNQKIKGRNLQEKIKTYIIEEDKKKDDGKYPILFDPQTLD